MSEIELTDEDLNIMHGLSAKAAFTSAVAPLPEARFKLSRGHIIRYICYQVHLMLNS